MRLKRGVCVAYAWRKTPLSCRIPWDRLACGLGQQVVVAAQLARGAAHPVKALANLPQPTQPELPMRIRQGNVFPSVTAHADVVKTRRSIQVLRDAPWRKGGTGECGNADQTPGCL